MLTCPAKGELCAAGEGLMDVIRTSGDCGNFIANETSCKRIADADASRQGFSSSWSSSSLAPVGCYIKEDGSTNSNRYFFNTAAQSTGTCRSTYQCVCDLKSCQSCPQGFYSYTPKGANSKTCQKCPPDKPHTGDGKPTTTGAISNRSCYKEDCSVGKGLRHATRSSGKCDTWLFGEQICKNIAKADSSRNGYYMTVNSNSYTPGCHIKKSSYGTKFDEYIYNRKFYDTNAWTSTKSCTSSRVCVCVEKTCNACLQGTFSLGGYDATCRECEPGEYNNQTEQRLCKPCSAGDISLMKGATFCPQTVCSPGEGLQHVILSNGNCPRVLDESECRAKADTDGKSLYSISSDDKPPGCIIHYGSKQYYFNSKRQSTAVCNTKYTCVCATKTCKVCLQGYFSPGGSGTTCTKCKVGMYNNKIKQNECKACTAGTYTNVTGGTRCLMCSNFSNTDFIECEREKESTETDKDEVEKGDGGAATDNGDATVRGHEKIIPKAESTLHIVIGIAVLILSGTGCCAVIYCIKRKNGKIFGFLNTKKMTTEEKQRIAVTQKKNRNSWNMVMLELENKGES